MTVEYRVRYEAGSNISFHNAYDEWEPWHDETATAEEVKKDLTGGAITIPQGLEIALERSGFDWWVEPRESQ